MKVYLVEVMEMDYDNSPHIVGAFKTFDKAADFIESNFGFIDKDIKESNGRLYYGYLSDGETLYKDSEDRVYCLDEDGDSWFIHNQHSIDIMEMEVL